MAKKAANILLAIIMLIQLTGCSALNGILSLKSTVPATPVETTVVKNTPEAGHTNTATIPGAIKSSPETGGQANLRFVVMADSRGSDKGINSKIIKKTLERIRSLSPQPEFAIMPGDLCDGSTSLKGVKQQLQYFKATITQYYPIKFFYPGIGNHEVRSNSGGEKAFQEVFSEFSATFLADYNRTVYFFDRGNTRFFMLNTDHPGESHAVSGKQLTWLKANIGPSKKYNMYIMHEPPYPTGAGVGSSLDVKKPSRDILWKLIDSSNNPMVFCGHEHNYTRRHINSAFNETVNGVEYKFGKTIYQVTTGTFGAPFYTQYYSKKNVDVTPISEYHFAVVDISDTGIAVKVYNVNGIVLDDFKQTSWQRGP